MSDLLDTADIAKLLEITREHCTDRVTKRPDFPAPAVNLSRRLRRWRKQDIAAWLAFAGLKCRLWQDLHGIGGTRNRWRTATNPHECLMLQDCAGFGALWLDI